MRRTIKPIAQRRKRQGKTDYYRRLHMLEGRTTRAIVRPSLNNTLVQFADFDAHGDRILLGVSTAALKKLGWKANTGNVPAAYLVGLLAGKMAQAKNIKRVILDIGPKKSTKGNRVYACLKGMLDAGLLVTHSADMLPAEERIIGKHIEMYAKSAKPPVFAEYKEKTLSPEKLSQHVQEIKQAVMK